MSARATPARPPFALDAQAQAELRARCERAIGRARRAGAEVLMDMTVAVDPAVDPSAVVFASRRAGEDWVCFEQPERDAAALAALGALRRLDGGGPERFHAVAAAWRRLAGEAVTGAPGGPPGAGLVAVGGFAFAPEGGAAPHGAGFGPGELVVPEVALARGDGEVRLTLAALAAPDDVPEELAARVAARAASLRQAPLPMLDPAPAGRFRIASVAPPEHYEAAVARAVERIRAGALEKVVLAREVAVHAPAAHDAAAVFGVLRAAFGSCFVFCAGRGESAFVAASPELLVRREGLRASTVALAGSIRRSADPSVDDHLGEQLLGSVKDREEQAIVARRIASPPRRSPSGQSRPSSRAGSPARCARTRSGSPPPTSPPWSRWPTSSISRRRSARSSRTRSAWSSSPSSCPRPPRGAASRTRPPPRSSPRSRASTAAG